MSYNKKGRRSHFDTRNALIFEEYRDKGLYTCIVCEKEVTLDDSFSNRGLNLTCCSCVDSEARKRNKTRIDYINKIFRNEV